ncbi:MAG: hypothetical protein ACM31D_15455 [Bacteroidota bacterium]
MHYHYYRMVLRDTATLNDILRGEWPSLALVQRRLFVAEWRSNPQVPDHGLKNMRERSVGEITTYRALVTGCLSQLADQHLEVRAGRPWVKPDRFADWQRLLTWATPLPILAFALWRGRPPSAWDRRHVEDYTRQVVAPVFARSSLPTTHDPLVDGMIRRQRMHDLHIHLNGTTEVDAVWLDGLLQRRAVLAQLRGNSSREEVLEQYAQIEDGLTPEKVGNRLRVARRIRLVMVDRLAGHGAIATPFVPDGAARFMTCQEVVADDLAYESLQQVYDHMHDLSRHPIRRDYAIHRDLGEMICEAVMLVLIFQHIEEKADEQMAKLLYAYLLILNATFQPLCVQQEDQVGFDQFQKITLNGAREATETRYIQRFSQIAYTLEGDVALVEGRFAPKNDRHRMTRLLSTILRGFAAYHNGKEKYDPLCEPEVRRPDTGLDLRLVAHFIKSDALAKVKDGDLCRFHRLRRQLAKQLRLLCAVRKNYRGVGNYLTGIDAAANELHTPPEVFAPIYRSARRCGFVHFTYHVGEDFEHLLSGIRAVCEALVFLDLRTGDRIGHGTALGICPHLWHDRSPAGIAKRQGDWLDDLVFAHTMLDGGSRHPCLHGALESRIAELSQTIYGQIYSPIILQQAWELRRLDPLVALDRSFDELSLLDRAERDEEWRPIQAARNNAQAFELFVRYHSPEVIRRYREVISVEANFIQPEALRELQQLIITKQLNARGVAIECPPTSNVRISRYHDYKEHHLFRWLGVVSPEEEQPLVCLASDDPGIFATNMRNEMIHVHRTLRDHFGLAEHECMSLLEALNNQGAALAFRNGHRFGAGKNNHDVELIY